MSALRSDALVLFWRRRDLACRKPYPALQQMVRRGHLDAPVVGVGRSCGARIACVPASSPA